MNDISKINNTGTIQAKRYEPDFSYETSSVAMFETTYGGYISVSDYEVIKAERDALAVENAALKKFCKNAAFDADYESELCTDRGGFTDAFNNIQTPATDTALATIEARGVEKYADHLASSESPFASLGSARNFAKQLREGK